jgi:uncharacterized protein (DUF488 family)
LAHVSTICSIGHSTRSAEEFIRILRANSITLVADIRTVPKSRHNPQFEGGALERSLEEAGIGYVHLKGLGGLRHPRKDSVNLGWRNESFRGYADHMETEEFQTALSALVKMSEEQPVAIMCAEGNPFRCHRTLVADALTARGTRVVHVSSERSARVHALTRFAKKQTDGRVAYPAEQEQTTL